MWTMLRKYIPQEEAKQQLQEIKYSEWFKEYGSVVSWQKLIDAMEAYVENYTLWPIEKSNVYWVKAVGSAQAELTAHVIQEYSRRDRSFYPCPYFNEPTLPRSEDWTVKDWFKAGTPRLGQNFAWVRGGEKSRQAISISGLNLHTAVYNNTFTVTLDEDALSELLKVRMEQRNNLYLDVNEPIITIKPTLRPI